MRQKSGKLKEPAEKVVRDIRRATRKQYSAEEKIRIVLSDHRAPGQRAIHQSSIAPPWNGGAVTTRQRLRRTG